MDIKVHVCTMYVSLFTTLIQLVLPDKLNMNLLWIGIEGLLSYWYLFTFSQPYMLLWQVLYFQQEHCGFYIIRRIQIFQGFVGAGEPWFQCLLNYKFYLVYRYIAKPRKSYIHENPSFPQSTKMDTDENKWDGIHHITL